MTEPARPAFRELFRERELWLLVAMTAAFFARPLFFGETFFYRDLTLWFFPQRERLAELVASAGLPIWDPHIHGGHPFLGEMNNVALYPTAVLGLVLPAVTAFNFEIVLHFVLCGIGAYLLARVTGLSRVPSFIAGTVFAFCGFTLSMGNMLNRILAMPHLPLLLLFWHLFLHEKRWRWFAGAAVSGALQLFAGFPELLTLSLALAGTWSLALPGPWRAKARRLAAAFGLAISIAALAAVILLPTLQLVQRSARGEKKGLAEAMTWSLDPRRVPEFFVPEFLGRTDTLRESDYWGSRIESGGFPYAISVFFGILAVTLAFAGAARRSGNPFPPWLRTVLILATILPVLMAFGDHFPLFPALYDRIPLLRLFRYPVKFLAAPALAVALLAGAGAAELAGGEGRSPARNRIAAAFLGLAILLLGLLLLVRFSPFTGNIQRIFFEIPIVEPVVSRGLALRLGSSALFALVGAALFWKPREDSRNRRAPALAFAVALELLLWGHAVNPTADRSLLSETPPLAASIRPLLRGGRFFRDKNPPQVTLRAPSNEAEWRTRWHRQTLNEYAAAGFDIPVVFHDDPDGLEPLRLSRLTDFVRAARWPARLPFLSAAGVSVIMTTRTLELPGVSFAGRVPNRSNLTFGVYRNEGAAPAIGFVTDWTFASSNLESIRRMLRPGFDPRREVVVEGSGSDSSGCAAPGRASVRVDGGINSSRILLETPCEGFLVFSQSFNPEWRLYSARGREPVVRADSVLSAARFPPGRHEITWVYVPVKLAVGAGISLLTVLVAGGAALRRKRPQVA